MWSEGTETDFYPCVHTKSSVVKWQWGIQGHHCSHPWVVPVLKSRFMTLKKENLYNCLFLGWVCDNGVAPKEGWRANGDPTCWIVWPESYIVQWKHHNMNKHVKHAIHSACSSYLLNSVDTQHIKQFTDGLRGYKSGPTRFVLNKGRIYFVLTVIIV